MLVLCCIQVRSVVTYLPPTRLGRSAEFISHLGTLVGQIL
jgi:hypothetical protein